MNAKDLLKKALTEMGADGLCNPAYECGCGLDDFEPCAACDLDDCIPAKVVKLDGRYYPMQEPT